MPCKFSGLYKRFIGISISVLLAQIAIAQTPPDTLIRLSDAVLLAEQNYHLLKARKYEDDAANQNVNVTSQLLPGSYTDVKLHFIRPQRSFVVPTSVVVTTLERKFVIKVSDGITKWVDVRTGFNLGDNQEIFGDLNEGDTLILKSSEELKEGKNVIPTIQSKK